MAPWPGRLREPGVLRSSGCLWLDSQVSTKGLAQSEPLGTPSLPLPRGFSSVEGLNAHACLCFRPLCQIWSKLAKGLSSDGAGEWREDADVHANTKRDKTDLISFENKGNPARVEFLHTIHSRHISTILRLG